MSPSELAALQAGIMSGLLLSHKLKQYLDLNNGNLDLRLQIRRFELNPDRVEFIAVGPIETDAAQEPPDAQRRT